MASKSLQTKRPNSTKLANTQKSGPLYKAGGKGKTEKGKKKKTAVVAAGELCPVKTEDVWLRGDSSNSKWLPFYKLGLCNKMRRGEYYQFSRLVKIAFLKPWEGWSLSREEPESVFLTRSQEGDGSKTCCCVCAAEKVCVSLKETSVKASYARRPSRDRTKIYFLIPCKQRKMQDAEKHTHSHTWNPLYVQTHKPSPWGEEYQSGDEVLYKTGGFWDCADAEIFS